MKSFTVTLNAGDAEDVSFILQNLVDYLDEDPFESEHESGALYDGNGIRVGSWRFDELV